MNSFDDFLRFAQLRQTLRLPSQILDRLCLEETAIQEASGQRGKAACCFSNSKGKRQSRQKPADKSFMEAFKKLELFDKIHFYCECVQFLDRVNRSIYTYSIEIPNQPMQFEAFVLTTYHLMDYWSPCFIELWSTPPLLSVKFPHKLQPYDLQHYLIRKSKHKGKYYCVVLEPITESQSTGAVRIGFRDEIAGEKAHHLTRLITLKAQEQQMLSQMGLHFKGTEQYKALPKKFEVQSANSSGVGSSVISHEVGRFFENRAQRLMSNNDPEKIPLNGLANSKADKPWTAIPQYGAQSRGIQSAKGTQEMFRTRDRIDSGTSTKFNSKQNSDIEQPKTPQNNRNTYQNCPRPPLPTTPTNNMKKEMINQSENQSYKTMQPLAEWKSGSDPNQSGSSKGKDKSQENKKHKTLGIWVPTCNIKPGEQFKQGVNLRTCKIQKDQDQKLGVTEVGQMLHEQLVSGHQFVEQQYKRLDPIPSFLQKQIDKNQKEIYRRQSNEKLLREEYRAINGIPTHPSRIYEQQMKSEVSHLDQSSRIQNRLNSQDMKKQNRNFINDPLKQARAEFLENCNQIQKSKNSFNSINSKEIQKIRSFRKASPKNNRHYSLRIADFLNQGGTKKVEEYEED